MDKECSNCAHWSWEGGDAGIGRCRRYPPVLMTNLVTSFEYVHTDKFLEFFTYVITVYNDTCGEWEYDSKPTHD